MPFLERVRVRWKFVKNLLEPIAAALLIDEAEDLKVIVQAARSAALGKVGDR